MIGATFRNLVGTSTKRPIRVGRRVVPGLNGRKVVYIYLTIKKKERQPYVTMQMGLWDYLSLALFALWHRAIAYYPHMVYLISEITAPAKQNQRRLR